MTDFFARLDLHAGDRPGVNTSVAVSDPDEDAVGRRRAEDAMARVGGEEWKG